MERFKLFIVGFFWRRISRYERMVRDREVILKARFSSYDSFSGYWYAYHFYTDDPVSRQILLQLAFPYACSTDDCLFIFLHSSDRRLGDQALEKGLEISRKKESSKVR
ncbi:MAG: hypothetical protein KGH93_03095 [Patescibacteria group bacterium]|nr:hypothetical protein [Patescibacteria group bacterium]MDE1946157.1 hypothetical protein [Patescibacteria group bacterium]